MTPYWTDTNPDISIYYGDCRQVMKGLADNSIDSVITDPPYELGFMGKGWDRSGITYQVNVWRECLRILKPGGHLLAFGGSRTYHRLACAIEDTGFEIRDQIQWIYGSGFPKSLDISKAIDAAAGAEREVIGEYRWPDGGPRNTATHQTSRNGIYSDIKTSGLNDRSLTAPATDAAIKWNGWGTALKPAHEPIVLARKPLDGTVAENVLKWGTGGLNIDGCRIETEEVWVNDVGSDFAGDGGWRDIQRSSHASGRWPANVIHDGSEEVLAGFPDSDGQQGDIRGGELSEPLGGVVYEGGLKRLQVTKRGDNGSAARFFYVPKASKEDREIGLDDLPVRTAGEVTDRTDGSDGLNSPRAGAGRTSGSRNVHPTVKPVELMRHLCRLITPPKGLILDPFFGSGSTGKAARKEHFRCIGIEADEYYCAIAARRCAIPQKEVFV